MTKLPLFITGICLAVMSLIYLCIITPNKDEKAFHQATLCNVIRHNPAVFTANELFEQVKFTYGNSTPSYAYHKPKFYQNYTQHMIDDYLKLTPEQQTRAKADYQTCRDLLNQ
ncbi:MAG: hypothetical protein EON51_05965 [Acinetobacter sp.]|nr:MAG: hypothetical protein EON51_05965 [Acinetobacter sp.]